MSENETTDPPSTDGMRLVALSDIDAFVEVRAGSILDEAAILVVQFLGGGDRNKSRALFVAMAMEHFDAIGEKYDDLRYVTMMKARLAERQAAREKAKAAEAASTDAPAAPVPPKEGGS